MSICLELAVSEKSVPIVGPPASRAIRVAVLCDLADENWPSMDLVGEMLCSNLVGDDHFRIMPTAVRPQLTSSLETLPLLLRRVIGRFGHYPLEVRRLRNRFDIFHVVDHSYAHLVHHLPASRTVVTCHDLDTFRCLVHPEQQQRSLAFRAMTRRIMSGLQKAAHVTCDTAATRAAILEQKLLPEERLTVVRNGVHPALSPFSDPAAEESLICLLNRAAGSTTEMLHVGSVSPRKRIDVLLHVFARVLKAQPQLRLLRVGGPFTASQERLAHDLGIRGYIDVLPHLEPRLLAATYRRASLVLQPSDAEGFGLPVIESLACGTRVLASDIPALREVGGEAAHYCATADIPSWTDATLNLLRAPADHASLLAQSRKFSWRTYASEMAQIYERVLRS